MNKRKQRETLNTNTGRNSTWNRSGNTLIGSSTLHVKEDFVRCSRRRRRRRVKTQNISVVTEDKDFTPEREKKRMVVLFENPD